MGKGKKPATYEDIEALPVGWVGEILGDELVASPRPAMPHARVASALHAILGMAFDLGHQGMRGGWWLLYEPELHFGRNVLVPDLAGWRRERMPVPSFADDPFSTIAPDWVCELLSERTRRIDKVQKMRIYAREGVRNVWHVDPVAHTLDIFRVEGRHWLLVDSFAGDERVHAEPFEAVELDLALVWAE